MIVGRYLNAKTRHQVRTRAPLPLPPRDQIGTNSQNTELCWTLTILYSDQTDNNYVTYDQALFSPRLNTGKEAGKEGVIAD